MTGHDDLSDDFSIAPLARSFKVLVQNQPVFRSDLLRVLSSAAKCGYFFSSLFRLANNLLKIEAWLHNMAANGVISPQLSRSAALVLYLQLYNRSTVVSAPSPVKNSAFVFSNFSV